jgi:hypothetical protein
VRIIETFHPSPHLVAKGEMPIPCIVEDPDGYRILVVANDCISPEQHDMARKSGVVMTVIRDRSIASTCLGQWVSVEGVPSFLSVIDG